MDAKLIHIYILFTACLVSSCTSDEPDIADGGKNSELSFAVSDISRTSVTTNLNFLGSEFTVYGDMKFMDFDPTIIFDKTTVTYRNNRWNYGNTQYWLPKHEYSFVAVHPSDAAAISGTKYENNQLSFKYTLPDNYKTTDDFIVATHRRMADYDPSVQDTPAASPVILNFWHIMSRINFRVKNAGAADVVRMTKIELEGINKAGTFTIIPAPLSSGSKQTEDYNYSWTGISNKGTLPAAIQVDIPEDKEMPLFTDDNALLMIPQPDNNEVILHITYTLIDAGAQPEELTLTAQAPIGGWESGKIYTYSFDIEEITKEITLTVSVKNWQTPKASGITVPES